jgi:hypothetical protein
MYLFRRAPEDDKQIETCHGERNNEDNIIILLILLIVHKIVGSINGFPHPTSPP